MANAQVISLFHRQTESTEPPSFLVVESSNVSSLQSLSPDFMEIDAHTYVIDLGVVQSYWGKLAQQKNQTLFEYLQDFCQNQLNGITLGFFCEHPFQGLVFLNHFRQQNSLGFFDSQSFMAHKLYHNMSWEPWFVSAQQLNHCFEKHKLLIKERKKATTDLNRLKRFVDRTDLKNFSELKQAHFYELQRRFHGFVGQLWNWTFPKFDLENDQKQPTLFNHYHYQKLKGFPWQPYKEQSHPQVQTWLEYPLQDWQSLVEPLKVDLRKLSNQNLLKEPYKVLSMTWSLILFDLSEIEQTLFFKSPISFEKEAQKAYVTLLQQLSFAFENYKKQIKDQDTDILNHPLIMGWKLEVNRRIQIKQRTDSLDPQERSHLGQRDDIFDFANKVEGSVQTYKLKKSFIPTQDFLEQDLNHISVGENTGLSAKLQPFYILPQDQKIDDQDIKKKCFLDRTSSDWWNRGDTLDSLRDHFVCELHDNNIIFAYRDYKGHWYQYGF